MEFFNRHTYGYKVVDFTLFTSFSGPFILRDILLDGSGRVLATGCVTCETASSDSFLVRLTTAGALDTTFSGDGIYTVDVTGAALEDVAYKIAMGSSGKIYMVGGADNAASLMDFFVMSLTSSGTRDTSFGTGGIVTTDFAAVFFVPTDEVAVNVKFSSSTGNVTVLGYAGSSGSYSLLATRYDSSGNLDMTFDGGDGLMKSSISGLTGEAFDWANATAFKGSVGYFAVGSNSDDDFTTSFFDTTLTPSTLFDTDGIATGDFLKSSSENMNSLAQDSSGNIYAAGCKKESGASYCDFALARYTSTGVLDTTFGDGDGLVVTALVSSASDKAYKVLVDSSNRPVLIGYAADDDDGDFALARYDTSGNLDTTFGGDGIVTTDCGYSGDSQDVAYDAVLDSSGNFVVGGSCETDTTRRDFGLVKYDANGNQDMSFGGGDGLATLDFSGDTDQIMAVALDSSDRVLVVGYTVSTAMDYDIALARFDSGGDLDTSFGGGTGFVTTDLGYSATDQAYSLALQSDGKIFVAGTIIDGSTGYLGLVHYDTDGNLDTTFGGGDGIVTVETTDGMSVVGDMIVEASGKIIVVGNTLNADGLTRFVVYRFNSDGSQDTTFMTVTDQPVTLDIDASGLLNDSAQAALIHSNGDLILGGSTDDDTTFALAALTIQSCGDGVIDGSEECDDGNLAEDDHCSHSCYSLTSYYLDNDADGYGSMNADDDVVMTSTDSRVTSGGYVTDTTDCDDLTPSVYPDATETCGDDIDQDCDGSDTTCPAAEVLATLDSDGDGVLDPDDAFPNDATESVDTDGDGVGNTADTDDDSDGTVDSADPDQMDSDGDGVMDAEDALPTDADNDGIDDATDPDVIDTDSDGVVDAQDSDDDADGVEDDADDDDDGDGITDIDESQSSDDAAGAAKSTGCGCSFAPSHGDTTTQNALMGFLVLMTGAILGMMRRRWR